jgi:glycosyltransferase involved in cell wall biosynthesis
VLFAGGLTQRKGLADLFMAVNLLNTPELELHVLGAPLAPMSFYRRHTQNFIYHPPCPRSAVLDLMSRCDLFCLPSIVEGRALVQLEALGCGLPLIVTANAGGEDLVQEGRTGFLVPMRDPEAIAARLQWFLDHRAELPGMRSACRARAQMLSWTNYRKSAAAALGQLLS